MNQKAINFLIPLFAIVVIIESLVLVAKLTQKPVAEKATVVTKTNSESKLNYKWGVNLDTVKTGVLTSIPLSLTSVDKKVGVDAIDLYINYDPAIAEVMDVTVGKGLPTPTFKRINKEKGLVVLNFLVSEANGFILNKNIASELISLKVNFLKEGTVDFSLGEASLVVENTSAKVLPFNSEKLVINVTR